MQGKEETDKGKTMRLDKYLASSRAGSRKEVRDLIKHGSVSVNGIMCRDPAKHIRSEDAVLCRGLPVVYKEHVYYMLNKPAGCVSATTDKKERTVLDLFPEDLQKGLFVVGRLDKDSVGLLIICDDGELAHALTSPASHVDKKYCIRTDEPLDEEDVTAFASGIPLSDGTRLKSAQLDISEDDKCRAFVTISEGKYHQIKRMIASRGKKVVYLKRLSIGDLVLDQELDEGSFRELTDEEVGILRL